MKISKMLLVVLLVSLLTILTIGSGIAQPKKNTIEEIMSNPGQYSDESVEVEGTARQYIKGTATTTSHYLLMGDYGGIIKVNTSLAKPKINIRYRVTGYINIDPATRTAFINEYKRVPISQNVVSTYLIVIILLLIAILGFLIIYQIRKMRKSSVKAEIAEPPFPGTEQPVDRPAKVMKTVKIKAPPKTMKYIPGKLEIISGDDKGKAFKIAGYPTAEGSIVTIGREDVSGDRAYAHIQLEDSNQTVSRNQAKIIVKDSKIYIQNLSETNYTQVDGVELAPDEEVELKPDAIIRMGSIELQFKK